MAQKQATSDKQKAKSTPHKDPQSSATNSILPPQLAWSGAIDASTARWMDPGPKRARGLSRPPPHAPHPRARAFTLHTRTLCMRMRLCVCHVRPKRNGGGGGIVTVVSDAMRCGLCVQSQGRAYAKEETDGSIIPLEINTHCGLGWGRRPRERESSSRVVFVSVRSSDTFTPKPLPS